MPNGDEIVFKLMTVELSKLIDKDNKTREQFNKKSANYKGKEKNVTNFLKNTIISINKKTDFESILNYIKVWVPAGENGSRAFRKYIRDISPNVLFQSEFYCLNCGTINKEVDLEYNENFFWADL